MRVVAIGEDQLVPRVERARATGTLPDVMQLPLDSAHAYARDGILDTGAAEEVVRQLREETFSQTALRLVSREGSVVAVPSDGWGQLLIYRKDLFRAAGLDEPRTLNDVRRAARRLHRDGLAGITLATAPGTGFTAETFEHVALIAGCQLVNDVGEITLTSPRCRAAFRLYVDLARNTSVPGPQDVDSTRDTYFAGRAAMIFWSPFLLDAMAGLRDDAVPTCPQCKEDPAFLARNSGLVGALGNGRSPERRAVRLHQRVGHRLGRGRRAGQALRRVHAVRRLRALAGALAAGQVPRPSRRRRGSRALRAAVGQPAQRRRAQGAAASASTPLTSIESLGEGVRSFRRWGFEQGQAALLGALVGPQPISKAVGAAISGRIGVDEAARRAQAAVEKLSAASPGS